MGYPKNSQYLAKRLVSKVSEATGEILSLDTELDKDSKRRIYWVVRDGKRITGPLKIKELEEWTGETMAKHGQLLMESHSED